MVAAIIFDMDGLLIDSEPLWREAEIRVFKSIGLDFNEEMCRQTMGMRIDEVVLFWHNKFQWNSPTLLAVESKITDEVIRLILQKGVAMEGVQEILEHFQSKELPMAIASSSSMKIIKAVVKKLKIDSFFDVIHSAEFEDYGKPHPQVFISTAEKLGIAPEKCLVFEDSKHGMIAALAAKMQIIVVPDEENQNSSWHIVATHKIDSLKEFDIKRYSILPL